MHAGQVLMEFVLFSNPAVSKRQSDLKLQEQTNAAECFGGNGVSAEYQNIQFDFQAVTFCEPPERLLITRPTNSVGHWLPRE